MGRRKAFPCGRKATTKCKKGHGIRNSPFGNHGSNN